MSPLTRLILTLSALLLAACGEYPQSVPYENGGYQGKTDQRMWDNDAFNHDQATWKNAVDERTRKQNEYARTGEH